MRKSLQDKIDYSISLLRKAEKMALRLDPENGFWLGFSGGKDKILVSPIIHWTEQDVWEFLNEVVKVPHCKLYDEGYKRIGCILCPMVNRKQKIKDCKRFPHVKHKWIETIQKLIDAGYMNRNFTNAEFGFKWWISGKSFDEFYADEVLQGKIDFGNE